MRQLLFALSLVLAGCLTTSDMPGPDDGGSGGDLSHCQGCNSTDMARVANPDLAGASAADLAGNSTKAIFGATCAVDGDCQSGMCRSFVMHTIYKCTQPCTAATQATDCPNPPSAGSCTPNLYCRFM